MRLLMFALPILLLTTFQNTFAQAFEVEGDVISMIVAKGSDYNHPVDDVAGFRLECMDIKDIRDASGNAPPDENLDALRNDLIPASQNDVALMCEVERYADSGTSSFFSPTELRYSVNGRSYTIGYDEYEDIEGETGEMSAETSAIFLVVFPSAQRLAPFTVYYEDEEQEVWLDSWQ